MKTLNGISETMLQTLFARAKESQSNRRAIYDEKAIEIVKKLDYDFSKANEDKAMHNGVVARTIVLDQLLKKYLNSHTQSIIINLACGLDTRCYRFENQYKHWYNLDLPETMRIRNQFFTPTKTIHSIADSAMNPDWLQQIQYEDEDVLVIIEGLTMYLHQEDVQRIFTILNHFEKVTVFVEVMNPWVCKHIKEKSIEQSQAKFTWGVRSGEEFEKIVNFQSIEDHSLTEGMKEFIPIYQWLDKIQMVSNISNKILVLKNKKDQR